MKGSFVHYKRAATADAQNYLCAIFSQFLGNKKKYESMIFSCHEMHEFDTHLEYALSYILLTQEEQKCVCVLGGINESSDSILCC